MENNTRMMKIKWKIEGKTIYQWIERLTKRQTASLWGQKCKIKPVLSKFIDGDGLQLIEFYTINQRPHRWILRVDSSLDLGGEDEDATHEKIETFIDRLESEFDRIGEYWYSSEWRKAIRDGDEDAACYDTFREYEKARMNYPAVDISIGWGFDSVVNFKS